jgi:hypothetical protein
VVLPSFLGLAGMRRLVYTAGSLLHRPPVILLYGSIVWSVCHSTNPQTQSNKAVARRLHLAAVLSRCCDAASLHCAAVPPCRSSVQTRCCKPWITSDSPLALRMSSFVNLIGHQIHAMKKTITRTRVRERGFLIFIDRGRF